MGRCNSSKDLVASGSYGKVYACKVINHHNLESFCTRKLSKKKCVKYPLKSKKYVSKEFYKSKPNKSKEEYWTEEIKMIKPILCNKKIEKKYFSIPNSSCKDQKGNYYLQSFNDGIDMFEILTNKKNKKIKKYLLQNIINYLADIFKGLSILHINNFVHLDIKPENILFSLKNKQIKIADFGFLTKINKRTKVSLKGTRDFQIPSDIVYEKNYLNEYLGKTRFKFGKKNYDIYNWCKSDIYSIAITIKDILLNNDDFLKNKDYQILTVLYKTCYSFNIYEIPNSIECLQLINFYRKDLNLEKWILNLLK